MRRRKTELFHTSGILRYHLNNHQVSCLQTSFKKLVLGSGTIIVCLCALHMKKSKFSENIRSTEY